MRHPELPVAMALAAALVLIPLPAHLRMRNIPLLVLIVTTFIMNIMYFVNSLVWAGNVRNVAPVWCDITSNYAFYYPLAAEGAAFCVCLQLKRVSSSHGSNTASRKWVLFEIFVCCFLPLISIPIRYSVSSHRYQILEDLGCIVSLYESVLAESLLWAPRVILAFLALIYAALATRNLVRLKTSLAAHLRTSQCSLTKSRFIRLFTLCLVMGIWPLVAVALIIRHSFSDLHPWPGWKATHSSFSQIPMLSIADQPPDLRKTEMAAFWVHPISGYLCFALLTTGEDVRAGFRDTWAFLRRKVLRRRTSTSATELHGASTDRSSRQSQPTLVVDLPPRDKVIAVSSHPILPYDV